VTSGQPGAPIFGVVWDLAGAAAIFLGMGDLIREQGSPISLLRMDVFWELKQRNLGPAI
jgi:hypothetical protein